MCVEAQYSFSMSFVRAERETGREDGVPVSPLRLLLLERVLRHDVPATLQRDGQVCEPSLACQAVS